jgi:hypothetical protein
MKTSLANDHTFMLIMLSYKFLFPFNAFSYGHLTFLTSAFQKRMDESNSEVEKLLGGILFIPSGIMVVKVMSGIS